MSITASLVSGDQVPPGSPAQVPCVVDACSGGVVGNWYSFQPGNQVTDQIGGGPGADAVLALLSNGASQVYFSPATPTWSTVPSVVHVGSGPTVTCALTAAASAASQGPFDNHKIVVTVEQGGALGTAIVSVMYDGSTKVEQFPLPVEKAATVVGTAAITPTTLGSASALTLVFIDPAVETLTFPAGSLAVAAAGLFAPVASVAAPVTVLAAAMLAAGTAAIAANPRKLRFTTGGITASDAPPTAAVAGFDYAGAALAETVTLSQVAGHADTVGVYATVTSVIYAAADGTGATLAIGYADAYASIAELIAEANTLAVAAPLAASFFDAQLSTGDFLGISTTATGTGAMVELNSSSTALTLFGLTASVVTLGLAATYALPWTGEVLSFPVGTYKATETYTIANAGPTASIAAVTSAMAIGRANWRTTPFGFFAVTAQPASAANAAALQAACSTTVNAWRIDGSCPVHVQTGSQFHTASSNPTTNAANILAADSALVTAFSGSTAALDLVAVDDCYVQGSSNLRLGSFRRSAVLAAAIKRSTLGKLGSDIAEGIVQGVSLKGPDGLTLARDEYYATVKLGPASGSASGPGFAVLKSTTAGPGSPKFAAGVTRAGSTSRFRFSYVVAVGLQIVQTLFARATTWDGQTWIPDPSTGRLLDSEALHHADDAYNDLLPFLLPEGKDPSVSDYQVTIDNSGKFVNTSSVPLNCAFEILGIVIDIPITVTALGIAPASLTP